MSGRWEHLLDQKPKPLAQHVLDEVSKLVAADLAKWPLPVADLDPETGRKFEPLLRADSKRPAPALFEECFRLAAWELNRYVEAIDDYMRNRRYLEKGLSEEDRLALLFVTRWLVEKLLALKEEAEGRFSRQELIGCLEDVGRRFRLREG